MPEEEELGGAVLHEPATALRGGADGLDFIRRLVAGAPDVLVGGGKLIMEFGHDQRDAVTELIAATGALADARIVLDRQNIPRVVVAERK